MVGKRLPLARDLSLKVGNTAATLFLPWQPPDLSLPSNLTVLSEGPSKQLFSKSRASLGILVQVHLASHN